VVDTGGAGAIVAVAAALLSACASARSLMAKLLVPSLGELNAQ
jgi:hypothetical protein